MTSTPSSTLTAQSHIILHNKPNYPQMEPFSTSRNLKTKRKTFPFLFPPSNPIRGISENNDDCLFHLKTCLSADRCRRHSLRSSRPSLTPSSLFQSCFNHDINDNPPLVYL
ncbi:hypothetical protein TNCV_329771 [Trichonephila clavipes]|nr:hypothetical protein TNCV_329771 [Trichonephila clavipes]